MGTIQGPGPGGRLAASRTCLVACAAMPRTATPQFAIHRAVLENGLRVVLAPDRSAPVVAVAVHYDVGFRSEPEGSTGFAHLFEHMMFQGSEHVDKMDHAQLVQANGGTLNGSTTPDYTNYFEVLPSGALELALFLEADRMRSVRITQENLDNQISVVKEEIRVNVLNRPYGGFPWIHMADVMFDTFANSHNGYGSFVDLESATLEDAEAFFARYYAPGNAVLTIVGDFDIEDAVALVERHFGEIPRRRAPRHGSFAEPLPTAPRRGTHRDPHAPTPAVALGYRVPDRHVEVLAVPATRPATPQVSGRLAASNPDELSHLWKRIWNQKRIEVGLLFAAIVILTGVFFFQMQVTRYERFTYWFRIGFLTFTLFVLGWYANAQLSVVNILAFFSAVMTDFSWSAFLMDPLIFILWFSVAASLLFWGRGVFCGWLCPFGALQELTNKIAQFFKVPQLRVPWGVHERLWPVKYMIFMGLFGLSLYSLELAERYAEIEPFKTAIILKFDRAWPFVLFVVVLLSIGLFVERFYCRYLCPLGAALAIPARLRTFDWLKRYKQCGDPCLRCANECMIQAIHPEGDINPNECHQCLHCQVLYQSTSKCPVCIKKAASRARAGAPRPKKVSPILPTDEQTGNVQEPAE